jgi:hypothetical protein
MVGRFGGNDIYSHVQERYREDIPFLTVSSSFAE